MQKHVTLALSTILMPLTVLRALEILSNIIETQKMASLTKGRLLLPYKGMSIKKSS
jgi:hypothetical protein